MKLSLLKISLRSLPPLLVNGLSLTPALQRLEESGSPLIHKARCRTGDPSLVARALPELLAMAGQGDRTALRTKLSALLARPGLAKPAARICRR